MVDILHRVGIAASPTEVYEAVATTQGVAGWWTTTITGNAETGGRLSLYFGGPDARLVMDVVAATPDKRVVWRVADGPAEWLDTTITFDIEATDDETALRFAHADWREPVDFMRHCSTKWAYFLLGLKASLEGGKAAPYPDDMKVSSWG